MATRPRYTWDGSRFRETATGRFITEQRVRQIMDTALRNLSNQGRTLANDVRAGRISREAFAVAGRDLIKDTHLLSAALARGGWSRMTPEAFGQVGAAVREQYAFFDKLLREMDAGLPLDGTFARRVASYAGAGIATAHKADRQVQRANGMRFEENVEDPTLPEAAHCVGPRSCRAQTDLGKVPIGTLIPLGQRACLDHDRCRVRFSA